MTRERERKVNLRVNLCVNKVHFVLAIATFHGCHTDHQATLTPFLRFTLSLKIPPGLHLGNPAHSQPYLAAVLIALFNMHSQVFDHTCKGGEGMVEMP
jgi:hypothetical protein